MEYLALAFSWYHQTTNPNQVLNNFIIFSSTLCSIVSNNIQCNIINKNKNTYLMIIAKCYPEHPLHPQWIHSTILPSSSLPLGTRQIQFVPKLVSLCCIQRKQHKFSYPTFFHLAIKFLSAIFSFKQ